MTLSKRELDAHLHEFPVRISKSFILTVILLVGSWSGVENRQVFSDDICGHIAGQRIYLEYGERGSLIAKYENNVLERIETKSHQRRCSVEFVTCPSCTVKIAFKHLNISRDCGRSTVFDTCGCDYVWIYEPTFEQSSGEQFCGFFIKTNTTDLEYRSQTRKVALTFLYNRNYAHAFTLDYSSERNRAVFTGHPKFSNTNNASQVISTPFFPSLYSSDLSIEHVINCETHNETCRISLIFTDFLIAHTSIIEFFDWNGERLYVTTGNIFRPPVIVTSGPSLSVRFYANGAYNLGFRAQYSFILGNLNDSQLKPDIYCGGHVNNLGGGITMMNMVPEGLKSYDCVWLIKPPETYLHMKTHLYVKVVAFAEFAGSTELTIHQGLTSIGPVVENLKLSLPDFFISKEKEHVVPISQGFYISLKGVFRRESRLAVVYAAFNYKDCLSGSDFLCHNLRCISSLLNCDGFDHCGDHSDEFATSCSQDPRDRRQWSNQPNFLFPKIERFNDLTTSTLAFILCSFGLIGGIFVSVVLLYRNNLKNRHQRQIQNHIETIHAILEEGVGDVEEEIIIPDDPPDYEAPPDYDDVVKLATARKKSEDSARCNFHRLQDSAKCGTSRSCQTTPIQIPDSPPPAYKQNQPEENQTSSPSSSDRMQHLKLNSLQVLHSIRQSLRCRRAGRANFMENARRFICCSNEIRMKYFSDSELSSLDSNAASVDRNLPKFGHHFTTDDINLFI